MMSAIGSDSFWTLSVLACLSSIIDELIVLNVFFDKFCLVPSDSWVLWLYLLYSEYDVLLPCVFPIVV